ncbi:MAG: serine hydrolase [Chitinophagaceae bacterium]|nr:serine hydrolase [Chitinophagaceae bacterium]
MALPIFAATMIIRFLLLTLLFNCFALFAGSTMHEQQENPGDGIPPYLYVTDKWVDSVLQSMTPDERIGQLFMISAYSRPDTDQTKVIDLIRNYHVGGIIFMQGGPVRQAALTNLFQSIAQVPLMISQDAEWGLSMRIDSTIRFPHEIMLGAIQDDKLIYEFGKEMARECKRIGVNVSFSPVVDVNSNPLNPVIGDRSFGQDKFNVARKGIMYMQGLQDGRVMACAKHFPGHGDTDQDSHKTLPTINSTLAQLDSMELFPFQKMIDGGVGSVMVAHLNIPALDTTSNLPSTLSKKIVTGLLKVDMGFKGLSFTDALNMKGVSKYDKPGEMELRALLAGNDILLFSGNVPLAIDKIKQAVVNEEITQQDIDARVRKILQAKYWLGLNTRKVIDTDSLYADLNNSQAMYLNQQLSESALTLVRNKTDFIPVREVNHVRFASVAIGATDETPFQQMLTNYAGINHYQIKKDAADKDFASLLYKLKEYDVVFVAVQNMSRNPANGFGVTDETKNFVEQLSATPSKVIITVFGSPYALKYFEHADWLLEAYNEETVTQQLAAQIIFGGCSSIGRLPVNVSATIAMGMGINSAVPIRVKYTYPEETGISSSRLKIIDTLANNAIAEHATPGCQVWIAKDGKVIWQKSYGHFTYDADINVADDNLYDLASITKVAATTMMLMKLYENKKLDLNEKAADCLSELKGTDKQEIRMYQLLTHEAGFVPYFPFYKATLDSAGNLKSSIYSRTKEGDFSIEVTPDIFMNKHYLDTIWKKIITTPLQSPGNYIYSDNDFYLLQKIAEKISGQPLELFTENNFYDPLGLSHLCFHPLYHFPREDIVPSNFDFTFRKELLQGSVHDQGAAMQGGVAGHAGLFSNANDLGVLMQLLLNNGTYAGKRYLDSATIAKFTSSYNLKSRRGLGFDKPETEEKKASPASESVSASAYGHQGFTGTCVWVDPEHKLVYVFLSNRIFPDDENKKLSTLQTRITIQQAIYDAMLKSE